MDNDSALWSAAFGLYRLLKEQEKREEEYQRFFEGNPIALKILGCDHVKAYEKRSGRRLPFDSERNFRPEPDFIGVNYQSGEVSVIELKTPFVGEITTSRSDGNRIKFKAVIESHLSQAIEYVQSIAGREDTRRAICSEFSLHRISSYRILLICGLSADNNSSDVARLCADRIKCSIVYFDKILDILIDTYSLSRRDVLPRPGICLVFHLQFPKTQPHKRAYIANIGGYKEDSISVAIQDKYLIVECIDSDGQSHRLHSIVPSEKPVYFRFEFANDSEGIYMSLNVDNIERDLRAGTKQLSLDPDLSSFVLGAGARGESGAEFYAMELYIVRNTLEIQDKLGSFHYYERKSKTQTRGLLFKPESFMIYSAEKDDLVHQECDHLRPKPVELPYSGA